MYNFLKSNSSLIYIGPIMILTIIRIANAKAAIVLVALEKTCFIYSQTAAVINDMAHMNPP